MTTDRATAPDQRDEAAEDPGEPDENAYEDHWYRMLKARSQRDGRPADGEAEEAEAVEES
jgi:hypothetical protein